MRLAAAILLLSACAEVPLRPSPAERVECRTVRGLLECHDVSCSVRADGMEICED